MPKADFSIIDIQRALAAIFHFGKNSRPVEEGIDLARKTQACLGWFSGQDSSDPALYLADGSGRSDK